MGEKLIRCVCTCLRACLKVEIEDMEFDEAKLAYFYPCPCGDHFLISEVCVDVDE